MLRKLVFVRFEDGVDAAVLDMNLDGEPADPIADVLASRGVPFLFLTGYGSGSTEGRHAGRPTLGKPLKPLGHFALLRFEKLAKQAEAA